MSGGRPSKLTPALQDKLVEVITEGMPFNRACDCVGIDYSNFKRWMKNPELEDFRAAIKEAKGNAQRDMVKDIRAGKPGWQGKCWLLERTDHETWGRKDVAQQAKPPPPADKSKAEYDAMPSEQRIELHQAAIEEERQKLEGRH